MPTAKRASMREGPLSALFRKTAEDAGATPAEENVPAGEDRTPASPQQRALPAPERLSSEDRPSRAELPAGSVLPERSELHGRSEPPARSELPARSERPAPPAQEAPADTPPSPEPRHVRSPQERLRDVFSADIPQNLLDPPSQRPAPPEPEPLHDVYARPAQLSESFAAPRPAAGPVLKVVGLGGAGINAVNRMIEAEIQGVEFLAINTDLQSLQTCSAHETLHIGASLTRGLGSGSDPDLGRQAAHEEGDRIKAMLRGADMVFIAAGAGGGTGTGAAPVVAQIARDLRALTVGIVTRPFQFEGTRRREQAEAGITALAEEVDTLIVVPNNRLLTVLDRNTSMVEAFRVADDVLRQGVQGISDLVTLPGLINLDFADVRTIMSDAGNALLGIGMGSGERRAIDASEQAVASPLLETSIEGARAILLSITGGRDLSLWEVNKAAKAVAEAAHPDANIIFGAMIDERLDGQVWVTVVATGYGNARPLRREAQRGALSERGGWESRPSLREPSGEPRVGRVGRTSSPPELDVPEFIPRR